VIRNYDAAPQFGLTQSLLLLLLLLLFEARMVVYTHYFVTNHEALPPM
jgi:hypothetical protein